MGSDSSLRPPDESLVQGNIFFGSRITLENFQETFQIVNWGQQYVTTLIFVFGVLVVQLVALAAALSPVYFLGL